MQLENICGYRNLNEYVKNKLYRYSKQEKNFRTLFDFMFSEEENVMAESSDGYRIKRTTYGECKKNILMLAPSLERMLPDVQKGSIVGIYMNNSCRMLEIFWALLMNGYSPLLMNMRLDDETLEKMLNEHSVAAVISDGKQFSKNTLTAKDIENAGSPHLMDVPFGKEVIFMSAGTTDKVKLCAYTAENFYYQICDSADIIKQSPNIQRHFEGQIKQLALLPFYHVFGFIAVYIWFGFFSRTFVFLKDMNPSTLLNTVRKHKVTHIFAVPLVWETIYKEAIRKIKSRGEKTYTRFKKALKISNSLGALGKIFAKSALAEVREGIFGDSICCLITGGSPVRREVLEFFNGIGYHLANGYGMTEIGITSVEVSANQKHLNNGSIGHPFGHTEYSISENGELLVRGKTKASRIIIGESSFVTNPDEWFGTRDLAKEINGQYFLEGRIDDLIVCENGENLNPVLEESRLKVNGCDRICLFADKHKVPTLIASAPGCLCPEKLSELKKSLEEAVKDAKLEGEIKKIVITADKLIEEREFKVSRRKVAERYESGKIRAIDLDNIEEQIGEILSQLEAEIRDCFAKALEKDADKIGIADNFFTALGGTSLDYFTLLNLVKNRFNIEIPSDEGNRLTTVKEFCDYIGKH